MSDFVDRGMQRALNNILAIINNPLADPEKVGRLIYALRDSEIRRRGVLSSRFQNVSRGVLTGDTQTGEIERRLYRAEAAARNASPDFSVVNAINARLGIGREYRGGNARADVTSAFRANPYRTNVQAHIENSEQARGASHFVGNDESIDAERLERRLAMRDRLREFHEATSRSGIGRYFQAEQESNASIDKREQERQSFIRSHNEKTHDVNRLFYQDMLDDYESGYHKFLDRYDGNAEMAEEGYKKELKKGLPSFFKDSKASSKDLHKLNRQFDTIRNIPFVGKFLGSNPLASGAALGIAGWKLIEGFTQRADAANEKTTSWANASNLFGTPSKRFQKAAYLAGISDPRKQAELFGKLTTQFGDAESAMDMFGSSMNGMSHLEKTFFAKSLGFGPELIAMMDMYAGNLSPSENRKMAATKAMVDVTSTMMSRSSASARDKFTAWLGSSSVGARMADVSFNDVAQSGIEYDKSSAKNVSHVTTVQNNPSVVQYINNVNLPDVKDNEGFVEGMKKEAKEGSANVLDSQYPGGF